MQVNISIDDVSPHPLSSIRVLRNCEPIIERFPDVKITLFVPVAYWRTMRPGTETLEPLWIDRFSDFCETLRSLPETNFEVCMHGLHHGMPGKSDNDEFQHLSYEEATEKFSIMTNVINKANLSAVFKPIFRPPAWRMSSAAIRAAKDFGIRTLALSPKDYAKQTYQGADEHFGNVVYYTCNPPFDPLTRHKKNEIVYHACEWDKNYLGEEAAQYLLSWLSLQNDVEFTFIENLCIDGKI